MNNVQDNPAARYRGACTALMEYVKQKADAAHMQLSLKAIPNAVGFYLKMGLIDTGITDDKLHVMVHGTRVVLCANGVVYNARPNDNVFRWPDVHDNPPRIFGGPSDNDVAATKELMHKHKGTYDIVMLPNPMSQGRSHINYFSVYDMLKENGELCIEFAGMDRDVQQHVIQTIESQGFSYEGEPAYIQSKLQFNKSTRSEAVTVAKYTMYHVQDR